MSGRQVGGVIDNIFPFPETPNPSAPRIVSTSKDDIEMPQNSAVAQP